VPPETRLQAAAKFGWKAAQALPVFSLKRSGELSEISGGTMAYGLGRLEPRGQQPLQIFQMTALGFEFGFQGSVLSFKLVERVELLKKLIIFSSFSYWNVPWHAAVTTVKRIV